MANLEVYRRYVKEMKQYATENGMSASETNKIFEKCFRTLETKFSKESLAIKKPSFRFFKRFVSTILVSLVCLVILYNHPKTHTVVLRNLQNFIYPGMRVWRKMAVPIVERYPSLSEWYDEWCLVENPYFRIDDMDCRPCSFVGSSIPDRNIGMPYTREEKNRAEPRYEDLAEMYRENREILEAEASGISSSGDASLRTIRDVFNKRTRNVESWSPLRDNRIVWRITGIKAGRLIRKLFPRPSDVPNSWSQSTERFVFIDEPKAAAYPLPNPECSNVALTCSTGSRLIDVSPTPECVETCQPLTILLSARHTLWYNWWYWKPVSLPTINSTELTINYLASFC